MLVVLLIGLTVFTVITGLQWYVWRRMVRDTTVKGTVARRLGSAVFVAGPLLMLGALASGRLGAPFWLQQTLAWPGYFWVALMLYLMLALLVGEGVRPLLRRFLDRRDAGRASGRGPRTAQGAGTGRGAGSGVVEPGGIGSGPAGSGPVGPGSVGPEGDAPGGIGPGGAGAQTLVGTAVGVPAGAEPAGADADADAGVGADTGASGALSGVGAGSAVVAEARTGAGASAGTGSLRTAEAVTSSDGNLSVAHPDTTGVTLVGHAPSTGHASATGPASVAGSASGTEPTELTGSADGTGHVGRDGPTGSVGSARPTGSTELIVGSDRAETVGRSRAAEGVQPVEVTQLVGADRAAGVGGTATAGPSRRLFVSRLVAGTALAAATATVGAGAYGVLNGPKVKRVTVPLAKLPRSAHGFRIAVVSDIHLGPILGRSFAERVVRTINSTQPDLIAIVGDLVDGDVADLGPAAEPLARLRARHGTYFVTGNHEYFSGAEQWVDEVRDLGLHPMENVRTELPGFDLAGVNDLAGEGEGDGPDFERALGGRDTARASVLLAHQPIVIHDAVRHGVDLQLSGHTHGGQLWPVSYLAGLQNPTLAGLERYGDTQLYVTRGAGAWGPPVRVGAESDITVVELASKQA